MAVHAANAASQQPTAAFPQQMQLFQQMQQMQAMMDQMQQSLDTNRSRGNGGSGGRNRHGDTTKYCWTHGGCAHPGAQCRNKAMLLDYCATYPNAKIRYHASDMVLHVDTDAAYLVLPNARSRYAGNFYLGDHPPALPQKPNPKPNGPIHTECKTILNAGVFGNAHQAIICRRALIELNHPQPPTPIKTDNSTTYNFVHSNLRQKRNQKLGICGGTGYVIVLIFNNFVSTGTRASTMMQITLPSITH